MKRGKRILSLLLALVMTPALLCGCGEEEETTFSAALVGQVNTLDPAMVTSAAEQTLIEHLYQNLMKCQTDGEGNVTATGAVARSWQCVDNLDGTETYIFHLRADAHWIDGQAVSAEDFVYAWRRLVDPALEAPYASLLDMVSGYDKARGGDVSALAVTAQDSTTLEVKLSCHCPYFLRSVCTACATMPQRADLAYKMDSGTAGNGAYTLLSREDDVLTLAASERYYDRRRLVPDRLALYLCRDGASAASLLTNGTVQMVCPVASGVPDGETWQVLPMPRVELLFINQMAQQLKDKDLRQALSLAIDRQALSELAGEAGYTPAQGLVPPGVLTSDGADFRAAVGAYIDQSAYEENCAKARELLAAANISRDTDLGVSLLYHAGGAQTAVAEALRSMWLEQLGLEVKLRGVSADEMAQALQQGEFSIALWHQTADRNDATAFLQPWVSGDAQNAALFHSGAYDMLLRAAAASSSTVARDAYLADAERLLLEQGNAIPLYTTSHFWQADSGIVGLQSNGWGVFRFHSAGMSAG